MSPLLRIVTPVFGLLITLRRAEDNIVTCYARNRSPEALHKCALTGWLLEWAQVCAMRLPVEVLEKHMPQILEGLLLWSEDSKNKFRLKVHSPFTSIPKMPTSFVRR